MSLPATAYTPAQGNTPAGQQLAQGAAQMANPVAGAATLPSGNDLNTALGQQTASLASMETPQARQQVVNTSDVPAMTNNYAAVAKQLQDYDQMYLQPIYSQNPGNGTDAPSSSRVPASSLFQLTPQSAADPTTLYADNPLFAVTAQANQQSNIIDLLNNLNDSIGKELTSARGKYASSVNSQKDIISTLKDLITTKSTQDYQDKSLALQRDIANLQYGQTRQQHFDDMATQVRSEIDKGTYSTLDEATAALQSMFPEKTKQDVLDALGNPTQTQINQNIKLNKSGTWELRPLPGVMGFLGKFYAYNTKTGQSKAISSPDDLNKLNALDATPPIVPPANGRPPITNFDTP